MSAPAELAGLPGTVLPEGRYVISPEENRLVAEIAGARACDYGIAHPLWAFIACQRGIGISIADLCALADFDVADGPMMGGWEVQYYEDLRTDYVYDVTGEVTGLVRKTGRSGTFDLLTFEIDLRNGDETIVASTTTTFVLPRRTADA